MYAKRRSIARLIRKLGYGSGSECQPSRFYLGKNAVAQSNLGTIVNGTGQGVPQDYNGGGQVD